MGSIRICVAPGCLTAQLPSPWGRIGTEVCCVSLHIVLLKVPSSRGFSVEQNFISFYFQPGRCVLEGRGTCWASQSGIVPQDCSDSFFFSSALRGCEKLLHIIRKHGLLWLNMSLWFL